MVRTRVTSKGQVTVPAEVRRLLGLEPGDDLIFELEQGEVRVRALHRRRLSEFRGVLPATRPFPGLNEIRRETGRNLAESEKDARPK
jgi:AbrB family looped-hinge helix DNA binding protein